MNRNTEQLLNVLETVLHFYENNEGKQSALEQKWRHAYN